MRVSLTKWNVDSKLDSVSVDPRLGLFAAEEAARGMTPYVPMLDGPLSQNYTTRAFEIHYTMEYAAYQYHGKGHNFTRDHHPLATYEWDKEYINRHGSELADSLTAYLRTMR